MNNMDLALGECEWPDNSSQIDFQLIDGSLTGQCKDCKCALDIITIQDILNRVPPTLPYPYPIVALI